MRYFFIDGSYVPKHCIYGPRPREAVVLNDWEWYKITDNLYKNNREKEMAHMYLAKEQNKKELSFNMTKNWQNTLASIKTQSEQRRIDKKKKEKQDKIDQYNKILQNRKEERIPVLAKAKKMLFEAKDTTRMLTSAMVQCSVLAEREKQIEFHNYLREEQAKKDSLYVEGIIKDVEDFKKEKQEEHLKMLEMKKKIRNDLLKQAEEKRKRFEEMESKERRATEADQIKMRETIEKLEKCQKQEKLSAVKRTTMNYEKGYHALELEKSRAIEEDEENEVNRMIKAYAKRFERERAQKEGKMIEEMVKNREKITESLSKKLNKEKNNEEEIYEKAVREIEEENEKVEKKREELKSKCEFEMRTWEKEHKARVDEGRRAREESLKWTILQNARKREIDKIWEDERKRKETETKVNTHECYAKQIKEKRELSENDRERETAFIPVRDEEMDDVLKYCNDALEYTKKHEWKNYPLLAAVARVKKSYGTAPEPFSNVFTKPETQESKLTEPEIQNKRPLGSFNYDCYCFRN